MAATERSILERTRRARRQQPHPVGGLDSVAGRSWPTPVIGANAPGLKSRSDRVDGSLARDLDRAAERGLRLAPRPLPVELVGDVGEDQPADVRRGGRARPPRAAVMWPRGPSRLGLGQRGLDQQQVARRSRTRSGRRWAGGRRRRSCRSPPFGDLDRVGRGEVRHRLEARSSAAPIRSTSLVAYSSQVEGLLDQAPRRPTRRPRGGTTAPRPGGRVEVRPARRTPLLARRVGERVGVRDEVEEVVGVQVGDERPRRRRVVGEAAQLPEHAVAAVDQQRGRRRPRRGSRCRRRRRPARRATCPGR